ncbi:mas-related G-protein coupled receptor member A8-like [Cyanistes caeruleus]|uniref:mas-related G-protein coupled receptor member A8-like n=1 Tax=Cyanistes caeruleus TaxID=156563 RepID=UPI000CDAE824|nr:mas-related G-protein coupled receptor member A8-like [Cyanistes caeruleus]
MKVSTVFPHFSAQTNGPVPCEISVSAVIIHIVTLLICLCGLAGNGVVLWLLNINTITNYIFNQATMDFLFLIFMVPSTLLFLHEEVSCSTIMPWMYFSLLFQLSQFSYNIGLYRLTFISFYRCKSILCLVFCGCQLPLRLLRAMRTTLFWAFFFVFIFVNPMVTSQCQSQEQEHCQVALLSMYVLSFFLFATPMLISSIIVFVHFKRGSQQREQKRLDIVIFLTALLSLPLSLLYLLQQLEYVFVSTQVIFLLTCINSSIKPFIYFLVGSWKADYSLESCWRDCSIDNCRSHISMQSLRMALQRVFEEPEENTATSNENTASSNENTYSSDENTASSDENTASSNENTDPSDDNTAFSDDAIMDTAV